MKNVPIGGKGMSTVNNNEMMLNSETIHHVHF